MCQLPIVIDKISRERKGENMRQTKRVKGWQEVFKGSLTHGVYIVS